MNSVHEVHRDVADNEKSAEEPVSIMRLEPHARFIISSRYTSAEGSTSMEANAPKQTDAAQAPGTHNFEKSSNLPAPALEAWVIQSVCRYHGLTGQQSDTQISLSDEAADLLATVVEFRLRIVLQEAVKLAKRSVASRAKRGCVTYSNVLTAQKILQITPARTGNNVHCASSVIMPSKAPSRMSSSFFIELASTSPSQILSILNDSFKSPERDSLAGISLDCGTLASHQPNAEPETPSTASLSLYWVAVDGKFACHDHNPFIIVDATTQSYQEKYHLRVRSIKQNDTEKIPLRSDQLNLIDHLNSVEIVSQTEAVSHVLSREHVLLFNQIRNALRRPYAEALCDEEQTLLILNTLETSSGLSQLLPYISHFLVSQVYSTLKLPPPCTSPIKGLQTTIRAMLSIVHNETLQLQHWLHQVVQALLYIVLHPLLGIDFSTFSEASFLRYYAAKAVAILGHKYASNDGGKTIELIQKQYKKAFQTINQPITTILGAVIGIRCLSTSSARALILPALPLLLRICTSLSHSPENIPQSLNTSQESSASLVKLTSLTTLLTCVKTDLYLELLGCLAECYAESQHHLTVEESEMLKVITEQLQEDLGEKLLPSMLAAIQQRAPEVSRDPLAMALI